jgi:hypothetical protein
MHSCSLLVLALIGVAKAASVVSPSATQTASDEAAQTGQNVLGAVTSDIASQAKNPALANALTQSNDAFVAAGQQVAQAAGTSAIRSKAASGGANEASSIQSGANDLALQTVEVDKSLLTIANPKSTPQEVKAAAAQALADELAEGDERSLLAQASSNQATANNFLNQVNQLGPSVVINGFTQIAQGQGDAQQLAFAITNAREQVIVPANCALIQSGSGSNLCATRQAVDPAIFSRSSSSSSSSTGAKGQSAKWQRFAKRANLRRR